MIKDVVCKKYHCYNEIIYYHFIKKFLSTDKEEYLVIVSAFTSTLTV